MAILLNLVKSIGLTENDNFAESSPPQRIIVWPVHSMHGAAVLVPPTSWSISIAWQSIKRLPLG